ncbi:MAG: class I SAM-dependent methyltransferase, partial [Cyanobacteriota bacterium]
QDEEVEKMPWYNPVLDHDLFNTLIHLDTQNKLILDIGTGPGTQAIELAKMGLNVIATDISKTAIVKASARAISEKVNIRFIHDDILKTRLEPEFDYIFDRGCFHVLAPENRSDYARIIHNLLKPGGFLFLKCFSEKEPGNEGPYRFTPDQLKETFSPYFRINSIDETIFKANRKPLPKALYAILHKNL